MPCRWMAPCYGMPLQINSQIPTIFVIFQACFCIFSTMNKCTTRVEFHLHLYFHFHVLKFTFLWLRPVLDWYIGESTVLISNISNGIKKRTQLVWKMELPLKYCYLVGITRWENLCIPKSLFGSTPSEYHIITRVISLTYMGSWMVYKLKWY